MIKYILMIIFVSFFISPAWADSDKNSQISVVPIYTSYGTVNVATKTAMSTYQSIKNIKPVSAPQVNYNQPKFPSQSGYAGLTQQMTMKNQLQKFDQMYNVNASGTKLATQPLTSNTKVASPRPRVTVEHSKIKSIDTQEVVKDKD